MFEFSWTSLEQGTECEMHSEEHAQSESISTPIPDENETCTATVLENYDYGPSPFSNTGSHNSNQNDGVVQDISSSEETLINIDESLMKENISQSELRAAIAIGPDSSNKTRYSYESYPKDEDGKTFPISILGKQQSNGERIERDWLMWNSKAIHCIAIHVVYSQSFLILPNQAFQNPKAVINGNYKSYA